jgi:hypothetical protein
MGRSFFNDLVHAEDRDVAASLTKPTHGEFTYRGAVWEGDILVYLLKPNFLSSSVHVKQSYKKKRKKKL